MGPGCTRACPYCDIDFADAFPLGSFNAQPVGFQQGIVSAPKAPESLSTLGSDWAAISYTPAIGM